MGLVIQINTNGGFEVWSVNRGNQQSKRLFFKTGQIKTANTEAESSDGAIVVVNDSSIENKSWGENFLWTNLTQKIFLYENLGNSVMIT